MYAILDLETANNDRGSVCAIGIVYVEDNSVVDTYYTLVNPHSEFSNMCMRIHHIKPEHVTDAPSFADVWPGLYAKLRAIPIVAYNASYDMYHLEKAIYDAGYGEPNLRYTCALKLAKQWVPAQSHKLENVAAHFGITYTPHEALDDARATAGIMIAMMRSHDVTSLHSFMRLSNRSYDYTIFDKYDPVTDQVDSDNVQVRTKSFQHGDGTALKGKGIYICGALNMLTKDELKVTLAEVSCNYKAKLTKQVDMVIISDKALGTDRADKCISDARAINNQMEIINESEFIDMLME